MGTWEAYEVLKGSIYKVKQKEILSKLNQILLYIFFNLKNWKYIALKPRGHFNNKVTNLMRNKIIHADIFFEHNCLITNSILKQVESK